MNHAQTLAAAPLKVVKTLSAKIKRAGTDEWIDLGVIASSEVSQGPVEPSAVTGKEQ